MVFTVVVGFVLFDELIGGGVGLFERLTNPVVWRTVAASEPLELKTKKYNNQQHESLKEKRKGDEGAGSEGEILYRPLVKESVTLPFLLFWGATVEVLLLFVTFPEKGGRRVKLAVLVSVVPLTSSRV